VNDALSGALDAQIARETEHEPGERLPAEIRLGPEEDHGIAAGAGYLAVEEAVLRPLELARHSVLEGDLRPRGLEVVERLRLDLRELLRFPLLGEIAGAERCALPAVVPTAESGDENGPAKLRHERNVQLGHFQSLVSV